MRLKLLCILLCCTVFAAATVTSASASSPSSESIAIQSDIPLYPGSTVTMQLKLRDEDVLLLVRQAIAGLVAAAERNDGAERSPEGITAIVREFDLEGLSEIIGGLRQVSATGARLPGRNSDARRVLDFYDRTLSEEGWNKILYAVPGDGGGLLVHALPSAEGFFIAGINAKNRSELFVARTVGFIDVQKAVTWLANAAEAAERHKKISQPEKAPEASSPQSLPAEGE